MSLEQPSKKGVVVEVFRLHLEVIGRGIDLKRLEDISHRRISQAICWFESNFRHQTLGSQMTEWRNGRRKRILGTFKTQFSASTPRIVFKTMPRKSIWRGRQLVTLCRDGFDSHTRRWRAFTRFVLTSNSSSGRTSVSQTGTRGFESRIVNYSAHSTRMFPNPGVASMERHLPSKEKSAGSIPVARSTRHPLRRAYMQVRWFDSNTLLQVWGGLPWGRTTFQVVYPSYLSSNNSGV